MSCCRVVPQQLIAWTLSLDCSDQILKEQVAEYTDCLIVTVTSLILLFRRWSLRSLRVGAQGRAVHRYPPPPPAPTPPTPLRHPTLSNPKPYTVLCTQSNMKEEKPFGRRDHQHGRIDILHRYAPVFGVWGGGGEGRGVLALGTCRAKHHAVGGAFPEPA